MKGVLQWLEGRALWLDGDVPITLGNPKDTHQVPGPDQAELKSKHSKNHRVPPSQKSNLDTTLWVSDTGSLVPLKAL